MKKILVISSLPFLLFSFTNFTLAAVCAPCDTDAECGGLTCVSDPKPGDGKKRGVCQDPKKIVFCPPIVHKTFEELINAIVNFIFVLAMVVCPLVIIIGAFLLLTSGGDPKKVETGKNMILYALIGLIIVLLAKGIIAMIQEAIGVRR